MFMYVFKQYASFSFAESFNCHNVSRKVHSHPNTQTSHNFERLLMFIQLYSIYSRVNGVSKYTLLIEVILIGLKLFY